MENAVNKLKNLRRERQLSQDELAHKLGVSRQTIFAIETGRSEPSLSLALRLCELLNAEIEEIFFPYSLSNRISQDQPINREEVSEMTRLIPWSPFNELTDLHREIDRFFEDSVSTPRSQNMVAAMNVRDMGDSFAIEVSVPGFKDEEIDIEAGKDFLTIKGEKKEENQDDGKGYLKREFAHAQFERTIALPTEIQTDKIDADLEHGTLKIRLPKVAPSPPQATKVKVKTLNNKSGK